MRMKETIDIEGAKVHNLKNVTLSIPQGEFTVITGLSGSGKSSLAFDTLFAEGQRRYVESLSSYARQFLGRIAKPNVDNIRGIAPSIAIEQKVSSRNPRSTVGTTTEVYDYLKLLFARIGRIYSPISGNEVVADTLESISEYAIELGEGSRLVVTAPFVVAEGASPLEHVTNILENGYDRFYIDSSVVYIEEVVPTIEEYMAKAELQILIDRMRVDSSEDGKMRLDDAISQALVLGEGRMQLEANTKDGNHIIREFSQALEADGMSFEAPSEHLFSFNNPFGACPQCQGYGKVTGIDEDLVVPDKDKSLFEDGIACWRGDTMKWWKEQVIDSAAASGFPIHRPYYKLSSKERKELWGGTRHFKGIDQFFDSLNKEKYKIQYRVLISRYTGKRTCPMCEGGRLRPEASYIKVGGYRIMELTNLSIERLIPIIEKLDITPREYKIAERIIAEILARLQSLFNVGLSYLTLSRLSSSLSGGESQRVNLATSLSSSLVGAMYVLDEPSIGLHPRDSQLLIGVLKSLRDVGNTVIVVEHDEEIMLSADHIVDIGPLAGEHGGEVVFEGSPKSLKKAKNSLTADYLLGRKSIPRPQKYRSVKDKIEIKGARLNNLQRVDVAFPLGMLCSVTGVSGSGKSSLVRGVLYPALYNHFNLVKSGSTNYDELSGDINRIKGVEMVDQNPIGRSSRSNPVTYIKAYDDIRKLFSEQPYAKMNSFTPSHFSFNIAGGRCDECEGEGIIRVSMQFMADVEMTCESCGGRRFKDDILEVKYKGHSIDDILSLSVSEAIAFFEKGGSLLERKIVDRLKTLEAVGLGYVRLGQSSSTLSGGESQRVKLAYFLTKEAGSSNMLFIFDEPTTGLHFHDINKLLDSFNALIAKGHSVIVIEHNMDVIAASDYVIDLGPEGGEKGGEIVFCGTPKELSECKKGYTANFLAKNFANKK